MSTYNKYYSFAGNNNYGIAMHVNIVGIIILTAFNKCLVYTPTEQWNLYIMCVSYYKVPFMLILNNVHSQLKLNTTLKYIVGWYVPRNFKKK